MHARVVVNRIPYVMTPSPDNRTNLFRSVTSCKKLWAEKRVKLAILHVNRNIRMRVTQKAVDLESKLFVETPLSFLLSPNLKIYHYKSLTYFCRLRKTYQEPKFVRQSLRIV